MRWLKAALWALLALTALFALVLLWLFNSDSGLRFALDRGLGFAPGVATIEHTEGRLLSRVELRGVHWQQDGLELRLEWLSLKYSGHRLLGSALQVESLRLGRLRIDLPPAPAQPEPDSEPLTDLPEIDLPLDIDVGVLSVDGADIYRGGELLLAIDAIESSLALTDGRIDLRRLLAQAEQGSLSAQGSIDTTRDWLSDLELGAKLDTEQTPLELLLSVNGDLNDLAARLELLRPTELQLRIQILRLLQAPRWSLQLDVPEVDPSSIVETWPALPVGLQFEAEGDVEGFTGQGSVVLDGRAYRLDALDLGLTKQRVELRKFEIVDVQTDGRLVANGHVDLASDVPEFELSAEFTDLAVPEGMQYAGSSANATFLLDGDLNSYRYAIDTDLQLQGEALVLVVRGSGTQQAVTLDRVDLTAAGASASIEGRVQWQPQLSWDLAARGQGFDPGVIIEDLSGRLDFDLDSRGRLSDDGIEADLQVRTLEGELRDREFQVSGDLRSTPERPLDGELSVRSGASRLSISGRWEDEARALVDIDVIALADLVPGAQGTLTGQLRLSGAQGAMRVEGRVEGETLRAEDLRLASVILDVDLAVDHQAPGSARLDIESLQWQQRSAERISLAVDGSLPEHRVTLELVSAEISAAIGAQGGVEGESWQGQLTQFDLQVDQAGDWQLSSPVELAVGGGQVTVQQLCLNSQDSLVCAQAQINDGASRVSARIEQLPLRMLQLLAGSPEALGWAIAGELNADLNAERPVDGDWQGQAELNIAQALLSLGEGEALRELTISELNATARFDSESAQIDAGGRLQQDDRIDLTLSVTQPFASADMQQLDGRVQADLRQVDWLDGLSEQIEDPSADLRVDLRLAGSVASPQPSGEVMLTELAVNVPMHGLELRNGELTLRVQGMDSIGVNGRLNSGSGQLRLDGELGIDPQGERSGRLSIKGEDFRAIDTAMVRATIAPDLRATLEGSKLSIRGSVDLPAARVDLSRIESSVRPSSDVVIVKTGEEQAEVTEIEIDSDVTVRLGDEVLLRGFGFDGRIDGNLRVRDRPGQVTTGTGNLDVTGTYAAYGQDLTIEYGRLIFSASPLDNPGLNVRATRQVEEVTAGIMVRGTARQPTLEVFSEPSLDQGDALSYVVLGRPLSQVGSGEGAGLSAAAQALGVGGGNLLAQRIGGRLGLDEVGLEESAALGGTAFTVGKYLSPKLYVGYGVNVFDGSDLIRMRYTLSPRWSIEAEVTTETRGIFNWRLER